MSKKYVNSKKMFLALRYQRTLCDPNNLEIPKEVKNIKFVLRIIDDPVYNGFSSIF